MLTFIFMGAKLDSATSAHALPAFLPHPKIILLYQIIPLYMFEASYINMCTATF